MVDEFKAILELLGDVTEIGGWVVFGWLTFKVIILLSTTGAIVYCTKIGIGALVDMVKRIADAKEKISGINHQPKQETLKDVDIDGMCISHDGTYDHVVASLRRVRAHVDTAGGKYIHTQGAKWLRAAIEEKMQKEIKTNTEVKS